jgi:hypothetical protein
LLDCHRILFRRGLFDRLIEKTDNFSVRVLRQRLDQFTAAQNFAQLAGRSSCGEQALQLKFDFRIREAADLKTFQDFPEGGGGERLARIVDFSAFTDNIHMIFLLGRSDEGKACIAASIAATICIFFKPARID